MCRQSAPKTTAHTDTHTHMKDMSETGGFVQSALQKTGQNKILHHIDEIISTKIHFIDQNRN